MPLPLDYEPQPKGENTPQGVYALRTAVVVGALNGCLLLDAFSVPNHLTVLPCYCLSTVGSLVGAAVALSLAVAGLSERGSRAWRSWLAIVLSLASAVASLVVFVWSTEAVASV